MSITFSEERPVHELIADSLGMDDYTQTYNRFPAVQPRVVSQLQTQ